MKTFTYTVTDELGIHARPAGLLAKASVKFSSAVTIECNGKKASSKKLFELMSLCAKRGDALNVSVEGDDEELASAVLLTFLQENL